MGSFQLPGPRRSGSSGKWGAAQVAAIHGARVPQGLPANERGQRCGQICRRLLPRGRRGDNAGASLVAAWGLHPFSMLGFKPTQVLEIFFFLRFQQLK